MHRRTSDCSEKTKPGICNWVIPLLLCFASGCTTYNQQGKVSQSSYAQGNLAVAEKEFTTKAEKEAKGKDAIIWRLEQAAVLRVNGKPEESNAAFDKAQERIDKYAEEAKTKVASEAGALLSNQANLPYRGRLYDGIMLNTYKALNYMALGKPEEARVELIRAYQRQQDAVEENKRRIEKVNEELEKAKPNSKVDKAKVEKSQNNPLFQTSIKGVYGDLDAIKPYADYVNPFTVYLDGLYFLTNAKDSSDLERSRKSFERALAFNEDNKYVKADLETAEEALNGKPLPPATYVIFETGLAPKRDQVRIDIPIIVSKVSYVGAAFPKLQMQNDYLPYLTVSAGGVSEQTMLIASMDRLVATDFKNELPTIITKTIASTVAKAAVAYAANEAADQADSTFGLFMRLTTAIGQAAMNIADLRTWTTLPKEFQVCRVTTPETKKIDVKTPDNRQNITFDVGEGAVNLIYIKSISANAPLQALQIKLK